MIPAKLPQLLNLQGNDRMIHIAEEIGMDYNLVGTDLLEDDHGTIIPGIKAQYAGISLEINMEILYTTLGAGRRY